MANWSILGGKREKYEHIQQMKTLKPLLNFDYKLKKRRKIP